MNKIQATVLTLVADVRHKLDVTTAVDVFWDRTGNRGNVLLKRMNGKYSARLIVGGSEVGAGHSDSSYDDAIANAAHSLHWRKCARTDCDCVIPAQFDVCPSCTEDRAP